MIFDVFDNTALYFDEQDPLCRALHFATQFDRSLPDGRFEIEGNTIYAIVMNYETKPAENGKFESHQKYIDIQLLLEGSEMLEVSLDKNLPVTEAYSEEKDVAFYQAPKYKTSIYLQPGQFAVLYPHDIHRPCLQIQKPEKVRKMVIKVHVDAKK